MGDRERQRRNVTGVERNVEQRRPRHSRCTIDTAGNTTAAAVTAIRSTRQRPTAVATVTALSAIPAARRRTSSPLWLTDGERQLQRALARRVVQSVPMAHHLVTTMPAENVYGVGRDVDRRRDDPFRSAPSTRRQYDAGSGHSLRSTHGGRQRLRSVTALVPTAAVGDRLRYQPASQTG